MRMFLAVLLASVAAPAHADEPHRYFRHGKFTVYRNAADQICRMVTASERKGGGVLGLSVTYDARRNEVLLSTLASNTTSLAQEGAVKLKLVFLQGEEVVDESWGTKRFRYSRTQEGYHFSTRISGRDDVERLLNDLGRRSHIAFFHKQNVVTSFLLTGSARVVPKLEECAFQEAGLNPRDPFRP